MIKTDSSTIWCVNKENIGAIIDQIYNMSDKKLALDITIANSSESFSTSSKGYQRIFTDAYGTEIDNKYVAASVLSAYNLELPISVVTKTEKDFEDDLNYLYGRIANESINSITIIIYDYYGEIFTNINIAYSDDIWMWCSKFTANGYEEITKYSSEELINIIKDKYAKSYINRTCDISCKMIV